MLVICREVFPEIVLMSMIFQFQDCNSGLLMGVIKLDGDNHKLKYGRIVKRYLYFFKEINIYTSQKNTHKNTGEICAKHPKVFVCMGGCSTFCLDIKR